jgi:S-adenosylmethionine:tRNA ribosyltransferase-isomerase
MHPKDINKHDFTYLLPPERIAAFPLVERDASKLLVYQNGEIKQDIYRNIADYIPAGTTLVFNDTKVVEARILFQKPTGGVVEIFALEPSDEYPDITSAMTQTGTISWKCMIGGAAKWKHGMVIEKKIAGEHPLTLTARITERLADTFLIQFEWQPDSLSFAEVLHIAGIMPLPPYIKRETAESDKERYQTIYAREEGSVAAPTAGLHFTPTIFDSLVSKNISRQYVTLHVGAGTFKPVKSDTLAQHNMHAEFIDVTASTIEALTRAEKIYAVGTTSLRTMESLYWMGVKTSQNPEIDKHELEIKQWEVYEQLKNKQPDRENALSCLLTWMTKRNLERIICRTQILIAPGYKVRMADGIITNFHQPQSTLLLLIAALICDEWKKLYQYALENDFRFLSYGDGMIISLSPTGS